MSESDHSPASLTSSPWKGTLSGQRRDAALAVAQDVAARAVDRRRVAEALTVAGRQTRYPGTVRWLPYSVAEGDVGTALLCSYLDQCRPQFGWDAAGHSFLAAGARAAEQTASLDCGLYSGLSGLAFAVASLSRNGERYPRLLTVLDDELAPLVAAQASRLSAYRGGMPVRGFDLISGASGTAARLLARDPRGTLPRLLAALVRLVAPTDGPPLWATPPHLMSNEAMRRSFPSGNLNLGLAHGIPGPLSILALALGEGHEVPGQADAVRHVADWVADHRSDDRWGVNWPCAVPLPNGRKRSAPGHSASSRPAPPVPARSAWCYGAPGVARALWHAGQALDDDSLRRLAVDAIAAVLRRPPEARDIDSPTFCHGVAGLLQVVLRFAADTGLPLLTKAVDPLVDQLLAAYEPDRPMAYADLEQGRNPVDRAGLLDGASGIALVLLAAATDTEPTWDRLFLLS
ncbi:lanthionine synthetase C family protein [Streptomyces sp. PRKS01-29]|nr:lanthionine synthetase C family protein [Streptomyces sabulosicollis]MBI0298054.1 lanthionine synthetase C family protein [Streptomyces sabulosicollis]